MFQIWFDFSEQIVFVFSSISQNHRMIDVRKDFWRLPCPSLLLKQGHLEPWTISRLHHLDGNLGYHVIILRVKKFSLMFRGNLTCFNLCPFLLATGHKREEPWPILFTLFLQVSKILSSAGWIGLQAQLSQVFLLKNALVFLITLFRTLFSGTGNVFL